MIAAAEEAAAAGNYPSAESLLREAARLQENSLGPLHPDLANTLNNLGVVCEITGKTVDAEQFFRRARLAQLRQAFLREANRLERRLVRLAEWRREVGMTR